MSAFTKKIHHSQFFILVFFQVGLSYMYIFLCLHLSDFDCSEMVLSSVKPFTIHFSKTQYVLKIHPCCDM